MRANPSPALTSQLNSEQMLWKAMGVPLARAATQSSFGFAIVDEQAVINFSTPAFVSLLKFVGTPSGCSLADHVKTHFRLDAETANTLFASHESGSVQLSQGRDDMQVSLQVAELADRERIVIAINANPKSTSRPKSID